MFKIQHLSLIWNMYKILSNFSLIKQESVPVSKNLLWYNWAMNNPETLSNVAKLTYKYFYSKFITLSQLEMTLKKVMKCPVIFHYNACFVASLFPFRCSVKMTGILMMSFPAGVVQVFMENPNPTTLSFRIKNASRLEQVLINKQLITE